MSKHLKKISRLKERLGSLISSLGLLQTVAYIMQRLRCSLFNETEHYSLFSKTAQFPLLCRSNSSDLNVFKQIFLAKEYSLLRESGLDRISILKMDVEGAEAVVFAKNYESWLPFVDNIVIELHDHSSFGRASDIVLNAIYCKSFNISRYGELTVCNTSA